MGLTPLASMEMLEEQVETLDVMNQEVVLELKALEISTLALELEYRCGNLKL